VINYREFIMPKDPWFWTFAVAVVAIVVALAIWLGKNVDLRVTARGLTFKTSNDNTSSDHTALDSTAAAKSKVMVGEGAEISGVVGRVVGRKVEGAQALGGTTDVAKNARISGNVDEIIGYEVGSKRRDQ